MVIVYSVPLFGVAEADCASVPRHRWFVLLLETLTVSEAFKESQGSLEATLIAVLHVGLHSEALSDFFNNAKQNCWHSWSKFWS